MGFFDRFKSKKLTDDMFGKLSYTTFKNSLNNFYEGALDFNDKSIGVIIDADEYGPTQLQKEFFIKFKENYLFFKTEIIIPFLQNKFEQNFTENCQIIDFDKEFEFDAITIPRLPQAPIKWSICYDSLKLKHWVTIIFLDYQPIEIQVDG